jgi:hypothetical protein
MDMRRAAYSVRSGAYPVLYLRPEDVAGTRARRTEESACHKVPRDRVLASSPHRQAVSIAQPVFARFRVFWAGLHGGGQGFESPRLHSKKAVFCSINEAGKSTPETATILADNHLRIDVHKNQQRTVAAPGIGQPGVRIVRMAYPLPYLTFD